MNQRIHELADLAYKNHLSRNPNSSFGRRSDYDTEFAELILAECLHQCYYRGMNDELYEGQLKAAKYIEQHFELK